MCSHDRVMPPDPERAAERPSVLSFIRRAAGFVRDGSFGPTLQLLQVPGSSLVLHTAAVPVEEC